MALTRVSRGLLSTSIVDNGNATAITIDSSENVGIGVVPASSSSPTWQHIQFGGTGNLVARKSDTTVDAMFASNYYVNASEQDSYITTGAAARMFINDNVISFDQAASGTAGSAISFSEAMRIDSSGNLLVGKTASSFSTAGVELAQGGTAGKVQIMRASGGLTVVNTTNDGAAISIYKGTSAVGSIGSRAGAVSFIVLDPRSGSNGGVGLGTTGQALVSCDYAGANVDGTKDLGASTARFKDLYLSGTIALTTADNASAANMFVSPSTDFLYLEHPSNGMIFRNTSGTERMRIDSSGNLLVGQSAQTTPGFGNTEVGSAIKENGTAAFSRAGNSTQPTLVVNKNTNDGKIVNFQKDGTTVGSIATQGGELCLMAPSGGGIRLRSSMASVIPINASRVNLDATTDLGSSGARFKDLYRSGSTISTSDRNMKQDIRDLTDAERNVAVAAKGLLKAFRFIDTVEAEGDNANIHFGIIAQDLAAAFTAEGLDANDYQVYRASTFTDDDGNEQTRLGICYENLLAFIISAI